LINRVVDSTVLQWCFLNRFLDAETLCRVLDRYSSPLHSVDYLASIYKESVARAVIANQFDMLYSCLGIASQIPALIEGVSLQEELTLPVPFVMGEAYARIATNVEVLENKLDSNDLDAIIYRDKLELDLDPAKIFATDKRIMAQEQKSKVLRMALGFFTESVGFRLK